MIEFTGRAEDNSVVVNVSMDGEPLNGGPLYLSLGEWDRLRAHLKYDRATSVLSVDAEK